MEELRMIENELVPVYITSIGEKVVYGSELHNVLDVKSKFADWVKNRLTDCEAAEFDDYEAISKNLENGGRTKEYIIRLDLAKEMAMLERNEKGKQVRRYFIRIEKKYNENLLSGLSPELQAFIVHDKKIQQVETKIDEVNRELHEFKQTLPLLPADADEVRAAVSRKAIHCLGSKESNAYKDRSVCQKVYTDIYHELKRQFEVSQYKCIRRNQKETALRIVKGYQLPLMLAEEIRNCNAQLNFGECAYAE